MTDLTYFTSESVSEGHPDKMADQISDAILDALLKDDPHTRAGIETMVKTGLVLVSARCGRIPGWILKKLSVSHLRHWVRPFVTWI